MSVKAENIIWSCIEVVITGRTRNALALRGTWVRIPPTPFVCLVGNPFKTGVFHFFIVINAVI